ncbi:DNA polymerase III, delta prime subunit [Magnetococcus marinus MC-1]|uniref:DNA polymerase III, delta prime subunit n=1 Tax=Magnetococcus marinus (strain ATCC BAA-1437 / JCM 17883 / MC-1) TaxID=156889 RepID=A0L8T4_MAGMM|nr:DNA polymerase III subunit delta' [Magnetococcus marinus]ABK44377.1 DNA polymerase III, delta prime subunit [Magnetococcus marinus MC-1]
MSRFEQIMGQQEAMDALTGAVRTGRLAHGLLFYGPAGVGKRLTARALVRRTLCQQVAEGALNAAGDRLLDGCGVCASCKRVEGGGHPDLLWMEKEQGRTRLRVDQIRELAQFVALTPLLSPYKVAVIDEVSLMNASAANALLKTLEEPPPHSLLILTTCTPGALLPTIRSRCQAVRFVPLDEQTLGQLLRQHTSLEPGMVESAMEMAGGSIGRALELCDGTLLNQRQELWQGLVLLQRGAGLDTVCEMAAQWGSAERFENTVMLLEFWFQNHIRASLRDYDPSVNQQELQASNRAWLSLAQQFACMVDEARIFNLNRPLMLEHLFIRISRLATQEGCLPSVRS